MAPKIRSSADNFATLVGHIWWSGVRFAYTCGGGVVRVCVPRALKRKRLKLSIPKPVPIPAEIIGPSMAVLYALRVLRAHGLCDSALHTIYRSVVVAKLLYASSAWEGFANATDRNKIQSFINKSKRNGYCSPHLPDFNSLCTSMKVDLFNKVFKIPTHVLRTSTTTTPRQSYTAIWFTTQSTWQDSTREKLKACGL